MNGIAIRSFPARHPGGQGKITAGTAPAGAKQVVPFLRGGVRGFAASLFRLLEGDMPVRTDAENLEAGNHGQPPCRKEEQGAGHQAEQSMLHDGARGRHGSIVTHRGNRSRLSNLVWRIVQAGRRSAPPFRRIVLIVHSTSRKRRVSVGVIVPHLGPGKLRMQEEGPLHHCQVPLADAL